MISCLNTREFFVNVYFTLHEEDSLNNFMLIIYMVFILQLYYILIKLKFIGKVFVSKINLF